jgi:hypothetical protein
VHGELDDPRRQVVGVAGPGAGQAAPDQPVGRHLGQHGQQALDPGLERGPHLGDAGPGPLLGVEPDHRPRCG